MTRPCPECGAQFEPSHHLQKFCTADHRVAFARKTADRGELLTALAQTWRKGRHARGDAKAVPAWAFTQLCALLDAWNAEDAACGRDTSIAVQDRMRAGWAAADQAARRNRRNRPSVSPP